MLRQPKLTQLAYQRMLAFFINQTRQQLLAHWFLSNAQKRIVQTRHRIRKNKLCPQIPLSDEALWNRGITQTGLFTRPRRKDQRM